MNIQRFTAATSREALAKARMAFGEGTLILSNRPVENGVEVVATGEDSLNSLDQGTSGFGKGGNGEPQRRSAESSSRDTASLVEDDANQLAMSTLSFQDYVRERMARRRQEATEESSKLIRIPRDEAPAPRTPEPRPTMEPMQQSAAPQAFAEPRPVVIKASPPVRPETDSLAGQAMSPSISRELNAMKELIEDRFNTLNWLGQARQNPIQANLMLKLIRAGYSPTLSRTILERLPAAADAMQSMQWVMDVLERNLHTDSKGVPLHQEGGVFALVGATGVGKTTTTAKLAGLCARTHGPNSVGLITLDSYRVGAQEQLRAYGKMLGIVAHLAHDRAALQDLLGLLANKKMVLIDTTGLAPRDPRKREMMDLLEIPGVKRLLVLNAGGHGDTLEDTVANFKTTANQQVILSKTDEAVKLGPALDAAIRHQLVLRGITTGQRVPEDWEAANANKLVRASMRSAGNSVYDPKISDLGFIFSHSTSNPAARNMFNA
ncbi:flagellar biosynthesis protein FlhF [Rhodoferax sp. GW822-FHT02A01]|uniref:flagellar biosynthesis protein FlhF n=1 Tax=Rhodoferax sp. GW822-FHT02A01 TaxID=3141537 RepID=UPI00315DBD6E